MNFIIYLFAFIAFCTFNINAYPNERDSYKRDDPDSTLGGFFPFWGITLLTISGFFLVVVAFSLIGYLLGCRTPQNSRQPSTDSTAPFFVIQNFATVI